MKSKGLTPERLERIKQIITEQKEKETMEICQICFGGYLPENTKDHQCPEFYNCGACGEICDAENGTITDSNGAGIYGEFTHNPKLCPAQDEIATVAEVLEETAKLAPKGWIVSHEYPDTIGVTHPTLTDDQFISFGDINGDFGFNDVYASDVCGSMENLTDAQEIANSFWQQISKIYPNLVKGE
jgi:hypothetical protein